MSQNEQTTATSSDKALSGRNSEKDVNVSPKEDKSNDIAPKSPNNEKTVLKEDSQASKKKQSAIHKAGKSNQKRRIPWITIIALLLVAVLGGANYWLYLQGEQLKDTVAQLATQQSTANQQVIDLGSQLSDTEKQQEALAAQLQQNTQTQQSMVASIDQVSQQMQALAATKGKDPLFWRASEVEYLLSVANHRLVMERDVQTAKIALQDADKRLRAIGDPGFISVREKIAQEISQLENVNMPDIPGMASQITTLVDNLGQMPFVKKELSLTQPADESNKEFAGVSNFIKQLWNDLANGLFKVQRTDQAIEPLLPPDEKQYLIQNLDLKLEQARIALLNLETALFQKNLADIEQWVQKYFDQEAIPVINFLQTLQNLKTVELKPALPDISASLRDLRDWLSRQKNAGLQQKINVAHIQSESLAP